MPGEGSAGGPVASVIHPREADVGGFTVRRGLPNVECRAVGPWVFFDHMGPARFNPGQGMDVIAHPHINLATVTYLFEGELVHRDSIGSVQTITPGAINLMVAGRGIAHSERTPKNLRASGFAAHGLQLWMGLPEEHEESPPEFLHYPAGELPECQLDTVTVRVMMGEAYGVVSPVKTLSPTLFAEATLPAGSRLELPSTVSERAVYLVSGRAEAVGAAEEFAGATLVVFATGAAAELSASTDCRLVVIGGESLGTRYMWWNFVSSRRERIEQAKSDWRDGRFAKIPEDNEEFTPLPGSDSHSVMDS